MTRKNYRRGTAACALAALAYSVVALAASGDFDLTFAGDGTQRFDLSGSSNVQAASRDTLTTAAVVGGKIIAAGVADDIDGLRRAAGAS